MLSHFTLSVILYQFRIKRKCLVYHKMFPSRFCCNWWQSMSITHQSFWFPAKVWNMLICLLKAAFYFIDSCWQLPQHICSLNRMPTILQMTVSNAFSWMKIVLFWFKFHWCYFLIVLLISQHKLRSHYLNQWWSSMALYGFSRPQWVKGDHFQVFCSVTLELECLSILL